LVAVAFSGLPQSRRYTVTCFLSRGMQLAQSNAIYEREEVVIRKTEITTYPYNNNQ